MTQDNSEPLRVLLLATTFPRWEGDTIPQFIYELSKELQSNALEVCVLAPHYPGADRKETMSGVTVYRYPYFFPYRYQNIVFQGKGGIIPSLKQSRLALLQAPIFLLSLLLHTVWIVHTEEIDAINSHWLLPNGVVASGVTALFGTTHVASLHAKGVLLLRRLPFGPAIVDYVYSHSDTILPVSTHIRDQFAQTGSTVAEPTDKFQIQPMGAHTGEYDTELKPSLRAERDIGEKTVGLFVGRLAEKKGLRYLLEAVARDGFDSDNFQLTIVGSGPLGDELESYASQLGLEELVTFTGWVSDQELHDQYVLADFVVVPSIETETGDTEGMPTVIAEAFAAGNPVIGTDVGGIPDVVTENKNGYIVPQQDADELADRMQTLIADPARRAELSQGARTTAEELDWEHCGAVYCRTLRSAGSPTTDHGHPTGPENKEIETRPIR